METPTQQTATVNEMDYSQVFGNTLYAKVLLWWASVSKPMPEHSTQQTHSEMSRNCGVVDHSIFCVGADGCEDNDSSLAEMSEAFWGEMAWNQREHL